MKKLFAVFVIGLSIFSCKDEADIAPKKGTLSLAFDDHASSNGRTNDDQKPASIMISIKKENGSPLFDDKIIPLYNFGPSFTSESLEFEVGSYTLTKLWVLNADGKVIAVTPVSGSANANKVTHPLPLAFTIKAELSTQVTCEVVKVVDDAAKYGYGGFAIKFIQPDHDIKLNFLASTNPNMETHGYDSVIVILTSGSTILRKKLTVISPVQAVGKVNSLELVSNGICGICWTIKVSAYYESIDEVLYNLHINEAVTTTSLYITEPTREIKFDGGNVKLIDQTPAAYFSQNIAWENWAHLSDNAGTFNFTVKNDICSPLFEYQLLKSGNDYLYYDKNIQSNNTSFTDYQNHGHRFVGLDNPLKGSFTDSQAFKDFCPNMSPGRIVTGDFYFYLQNNYNLHDCYLVWMYDKTPIDPDGSSFGKYKMMSSAGKEIGSGRKRSKS
jgi:hypothetical protein